MKVLLVLLLLAAVAHASIEPAVTQMLAMEETVPVIVVMNESTEKNDVLSAVPEAALTVTHTYDVINGFAATATAEGIAQLRSMPGVRDVLYDDVRQLFLDVSAPLINATALWPIQLNGTTITGTGETVCVIDTGVDYTHPSLGSCTTSQFAAGTCSTVIGGHDFVNGDSDPMDDNGHGTHVAGTIISSHAAYRGIANSARVAALKACSSSCPDSAILASIDWCVANATRYNVSVISMSLGGGLYDTHCDAAEPQFRDAINNATRNNISVVVATGNSGNATHIAAPACITNATAVGAVYDANIGTYSGVCTDSATAADKVACFSNRNNVTDLLAPGSRIYAPYLSSSFANLSGTSMSAPHVSAAFALLRQFVRLQNSTVLTPADLQAAFIATGKTVTDATTGRNYSRINVQRAVLSFDNVAPLITIASPLNGTNVSTAFLFVNVTASETLSSATLVWNATQNYSMNSSGASFSYNVTSLAAGSYAFHIAANDSANNTGASSTVNVTVDLSIPFLTLALPQNRTYSAPVSLNYTVSDNAIDQCWFVLNNVSNSSVSSCQNVSGIGDEGPNTLVLFVNDTASNRNMSAINFTIDSVSPSLSVQSPGNTTVNSTAISLNFTISEANRIDRCWYLNTSGQSAFLNTDHSAACNNLSFVAANTSGSNSIAVYVNDTANNTASQSVFFSVDTTVPQIVIAFPLNATHNQTLLNFTVSDNAVDRCWYHNGTAENNITGCSNLSFLNVSEGAVALTVYANDSAGNQNSSGVAFTLDLPPRVTVASPQNILYETADVSLNYTATDTFGISQCWLINATGGRENLSNCSNATLAVQNGTISITLHVNDTSGNTNSTTITFSVNTSLPVVTYAAPTPSNETQANAHYVFINATMNKNISAALLEWNSVNESMNVSGPAAFRNKTIASAGNYTFRIYVNDSANNTGASALRWVYVNDTISPNVTVASPTPSAYSSASIALNFIASDNIAVSSCWYRLNAGTNVTLANCTNATITAVAGSNTLVVAANDTAGNQNSTTITFTYSPLSSGSSDSSGGGGGGGGSGGSATFAVPAPTPAPVPVAAPARVHKETLKNILPSVPVEIKVQLNGAVTAVRITPAAAVAEASVDVRPLDAKPAALPAPPNAYSYFEVTTTLDKKSIASAGIRFKVQKQWLETHRFVAAQLSRFADGAWSALPTVEVGSTSSDIEYEAITPGFSYFAVVGSAKEKGTEANASISGTTTIRNDTKQASENIITGQVVGDSPGASYAALAVLALVAVAAAAVFLRLRMRRPPRKRYRRR